MDLIINFKSIGNIALELKQDRKLIDILDFSFKADLDTVLIDTVDKFLKKNRINLLSLNRITIAGDIDKHSSAYTVVKTWISAVKGINEGHKW